MYRQVNIPLVVLILLGFSNPLSAQSEPTSYWSAGAIALWETEPYKEMDDEIFVLPIVAYQGEVFYWQGPNAGIKIGEWNNFTAFANAKLRLDSYDADDSPFLAGMESRDMTLELGFELQYETPYVNLGASIDQDVLSKHEGQAANFRISQDFFIQRRFILEPYVGVSWLSSNLANYYYGVRSEERRPDRPRYDVGSAINYEYGIEAIYLLNKRMSLVLELSGEQLDNEIEDSPIIEDGSQYGAFIGFFYQF